MTDKKKTYLVVEFQDGLQIIPKTWLTNDMKRAKWPNSYITSNRFDKAVKCMEEPQSTWEEHPVVKIFATCYDYSVARKKLKLAEQLSDVNICSDQEHFKKSRKFRAAKTFESSSNNDTEDSDETVMSSLPKPPCKRTNPINGGILKKIKTQAYRDLQRTTNTQQRNAECQDNENIMPCTNLNLNYKQGIQRTTNVQQQNVDWQDNGNIAPYINSDLKYKQGTQRTTNVQQQNVDWQDNGNVVPCTSVDLNSKQGTQHTTNVQKQNAEWRDNGNVVPCTSVDLNSTQDSQCATNVHEQNVEWQDYGSIVSYTNLDLNLNNDSQHNTNTQQWNTAWQDKENSFLYTSLSSNFRQDSQRTIDTQQNAKWQDNENILSNRLARIKNYEGGSDFEHYVVQKFQHLEMKISIVAKQQRKILDKMSNIMQPEVQEKEDIFQGLPLKSEHELQGMEIKLGNDVSYRNEMIKQLARLTGQDVKHSCLSLMRQIISNEVAVLFSWHGAKKKRNFSKLNVCKVILIVIRNTHTSVKDEQISNTIKIWLAHAKERMDREREKKRGRNQRDQVPNEPENLQELEDLQED